MTTGKRAARKSADKPKSSTRKHAPESSHLVNKQGEPHANVSTMEPTHGANLADRMDTMDKHHTERLPASDPSVERAGVPLNRREDEGQNRGGE